MGERKAFLANPKKQCHVSNEENMSFVPKTKRIEIVTSIQVCILSLMNFDYKEHGGMKRFSCKWKASISCISMWRT